MSFWAGAGAGVLAGAGGLLTNASQKREAQRNRNFQMMMSNTAHQREVKDLVAAGLNPILSANGGASTPQGSQANIENPAASAITSALEAKRLGQELKLMQAQTNKTNVEAEVAKRGIPEAELKNKAMDLIIRPVLNKIENSLGTGSKQQSLPKGGLR